MDHASVHERSATRLAMKGSSSAAAWAEEFTGSVRDDPVGRMAPDGALLPRSVRRSTRHPPLPPCALSFMQWQLRRGVLAPLSATRPGSPWWRAVNERILRDGCEAVALSGNLAGPVSSPVDQ